MVLSEFFQPSRRVVADTVDRLHFWYTPWALVCLAVLSFALRFIPELGITCISPAHFTASLLSFTDKTCLMQMSYLPMGFLPARDFNEYEAHANKLPTWIPVILFCQAVFFMLPGLNWRFFGMQRGRSIAQIVADTCAYGEERNGDNRKCLMDSVVTKIQYHTSKPGMTGFRAFFYAVAENFLPLIYLVIKVQCVVVAATLAWLMHLMQRQDDGIWGYFNKVVTQTNATAEAELLSLTQIFPTEFMCDFKVIRLGTPSRYSVQCTVPINFYYNVLFQGIWIWFLVLAVMTLYSFCAWLLWLLITFFRVIFTSALPGDVPSTSGTMWNKFRGNGLFMLCMMECNAGKFVAKECISEVRRRTNEHYSRPFQKDENDTNF